MSTFFLRIAYSFYIFEMFNFTVKCVSRNFIGKKEHDPVVLLGYHINKF